MTQKYHLYRLCGITGLITLLADQISKWWFIYELRLPDREIILLPFFKLVMVWNYGVSFGMFADKAESQKWLLSGLALAIIAVLLYWLKSAENKLVALGVGLVVGGAIGNVIDRMRFGAVADFFYLHYEDFYWPAFNIADSAIFIGVVLLCWESMVNGSQKS